MKNILVAVDFSKGSIQAYRYALKLAVLIKSNLNIIWVDNESTIDSALSFDDTSYRNEAITNLNELINTYASDFPGSVSYKIRRGKVYQEVAAMAKISESNIIVAGTHGVTGFEQYWIGSNAYRIVSYAPCPVITVRFDYDLERDIKNIVLPIDSTPDTREKVAFTCDLARLLGARLHIIGLLTTNLKSLHRKTISNVEQVKKYCKSKEIDFSVAEIESANVTKEIVAYAVEQNTDLIAIMTEQQRSASGLLLGPQAQQLVNYSPVPVLSVQPQEMHNLTLR